MKPAPGPTPGGEDVGSGSLRLGLSDAPWGGEAVLGFGEDN